MQAHARFLSGWIFLATVGCGARSTMGSADAAARKDGTVGADSFVLPDAFEVVSSAPDLAPDRDVANLEDTAAAAPDLAAADVPPDNRIRDAAFDGRAGDAIFSSLDGPLAAFCTGDSRLSSAGLFPAPAYSCNARPSGRCCTRDWLEMREA